MKQRGPKGFTLVELLLVITIIAILATIVITKLSNVESEARYSVSVANLNKVTEIMQAYGFRNQGKFGDGWDSLLSATNNAIVYPGNGNARVNTGVYNAWLMVSPLNNVEFSCWRRMTDNIPGTGASGVLVTVYDHAAAAVNANLSTVATNGYRVLANGSNCAFVDKTTSRGREIYDEFKLNVDDTGFRVVALGIGPHCSLVGNTDLGFAEAPIISDAAPNQQFAYRRAVALFKLYSTSAAGLAYPEFVGVTTSYGKTAGKMREYMK